MTKEVITLECMPMTDAIREAKRYYHVESYIDLFNDGAVVLAMLYDRDPDELLLDQPI